MRIDVLISCVFCGKDHSVEVDLARYEMWQAGELIQKAMPNLSATEREQLISGICPKCQGSIFGGDDTEEEEEEPEFKTIEEWNAWMEEQEAEEEINDADVAMRESLEFTGQWWEEVEQ